jgi:DNA-directed RNA polymerase subunit omega
MRGKDPKVEWDNDKPTVVALREIAAGYTTMSNVNNVETQHHHEEPQLTIIQEEVVIIEKPDSAASSQSEE